jgi:hypothetical protein
MSNSPAGPAAGTTTLLFQAPPALPEDLTDAADGAVGDVERPARRNDAGGGSRRGTGPSGASGSPGLRMLKGARDAAAGMKITDAQIRAVLEDPQEVQPDPNQPQRTQLRRDGLVVTTGNDGMILRVARRR